VTCGWGSVIALKKSADEYLPLWFSDRFGCSAVALGDANGDGVAEIYVGTSEDASEGIRVWVFDGLAEWQYSRSAILTLGDSDVNGLVVENVDGDAAKEIVLVGDDDLIVLSAADFTIEWTASGKGGHAVAAADVDGDTQIEIVVNAEGIVRVLDAAAQTEEWSLPGGVDWALDLGDVAGDAAAEIVYVEDWDDLVVVDGATHAELWRRSGLGDLDSLAVADLDGAGKAEIIVGDGQWGNVTGYDGTNTLLWQIANPDHSVNDVAVGDVNGDGVNEVVFGTGTGMHGDHLFVADWSTESILWQSENPDCPLLATSCDLDLDGTPEIVMASETTEDGYWGGLVHIYDSVTRELEWRIDTDYFWVDIHGLGCGQLDADPQLEIALGVSILYEPKVYVYDGLSHERQFSSQNLLPSASEPVCLLVQNIDQDPVEEIIVGLDSPDVVVLDGASTTVDYQLSDLTHDVLDCHTGDLDGDRDPDLAVLTRYDSAIFDFSSTIPWFSVPNDNDGFDVAIVRPTRYGRGQLVVARRIGGVGHSTLDGFDGLSTDPMWHLETESLVEELDALDLTGDGGEELVVAGGTRWYGPETLLDLYSYSGGPPTLLESGPADLGSVRMASAYEPTGNGQLELLVAAWTLIDAATVVIDRDGDGRLDHEDNCPTIANPGQIDTNGNGVGDACEFSCDVDLDFNCGAGDPAQLFLALDDPAYDPPGDPDVNGNGVRDTGDLATLVALIYQ
jgi:hypothetical protein